MSKVTSFPGFPKNHPFIFSLALQTIPTPRHQSPQESSGCLEWILHLSNHLRRGHNSFPPIPRQFHRSSEGQAPAKKDQCRLHAHPLRQIRARNRLFSHRLSEGEEEGEIPSWSHPRFPISESARLVNSPIPSRGGTGGLAVHSVRFPQTLPGFSPCLEYRSRRIHLFALWMA